MGLERDRELGDDRSRILRQAWLVLQSGSQSLEESQDFRSLFHERLDEPARAGQPQGAFQDLLGRGAFPLPGEPHRPQGQHPHKREGVMRALGQFLDLGQEPARLRLTQAHQDLGLVDVRDVTAR